jgi:hypothetical protein
MSERLGPSSIRGVLQKHKKSHQFCVCSIAVEMLLFYRTAMIALRLLFGFNVWVIDTQSA